MAGMMMCDGASPANCTMYSPMSDSNASMPAASMAWLKPTSSLTIDLPLMMCLAFTRCAIQGNGVRLVRVLRPVHLTPLAVS
jgi:hypothetical protein